MVISPTKNRSTWWLHSSAPAHLRSLHLMRLLWPEGDEISDCWHIPASSTNEVIAVFKSSLVQTCQGIKAFKCVWCVAFFAIFVTESSGTMKWWASLKGAKHTLRLHILNPNIVSYTIQIVKTQALSGWNLSTSIAIQILHCITIWQNKVLKPTPEQEQQQSKTPHFDGKFWICKGPLKWHCRHSSGIPVASIFDSLGMLDVGGFMRKIYLGRSSELLGQMFFFFVKKGVTLLIYWLY